MRTQQRRISVSGAGDKDSSNNRYASIPYNRFTHLVADALANDHDSLLVLSRTDVDGFLMDETVRLEAMNVADVSGFLTSQVVKHIIKGRKEKPWTKRVCP